MTLMTPLFLKSFPPWLPPASCLPCLPLQTLDVVSQPPSRPPTPLSSTSPQQPGFQGPLPVSLLFLPCHLPRFSRAYMPTISTSLPASQALLLKGSTCCMPEH